MKKENIILLLLVVVLALQVVLLVRKPVNTTSTTTTTADTLSGGNKGLASGSGFRQILTEVMAPDQAMICQSRFDSLLSHREAMKFPEALYIDKTFIEAIKKSTDIDGMAIIFGAYTKDGKNSSGAAYYENELTAILAPTKNQVIDRSAVYDYSDPCRPPCTQFRVK